MEKESHNRIKYWLLTILEVAFFLLMIAMSSITAIHIADYKMNVMYPDMCSCDGYDVNTHPTNDSYMYTAMNKAMDQCRIDCPKLRDDERSITIGGLSIVLYIMFELIYKMIKDRAKEYIN
jgi:hypothetical protein